MRTLCVLMAGWLLCAALVLCAAVMPAQSADVYRADAVKAAFVYRFTGYIDWPEAASQTRFTIAVLGSDTVADELKRLLPEHAVKNLPSEVRVIHTIDEAAGAQMLVIGPQFTGDLRSLTASLAGQPVLVVTDRENALDEGSAVNFLLVDRRVRFEISLPAATQAGLKVGPGLLSVAAHVRGGPRADRACARDLPPFSREGACVVRVARS